MHDETASLAFATKRFCDATPGLTWRGHRCRVTSPRSTCQRIGIYDNCTTSPDHRTTDLIQPCVRGGFTPMSSADANRRLLEVDVGIWTPWMLPRAGPPTAQTQCCDVCLSLSECTSWRVLQHTTEELARSRPGTRAPGQRGTLGNCVLFGSPSTESTEVQAPETKRASSSRPGGIRLHPSTVLLRSDAHKLAVVTRCHRGYISWLRTAINGEAVLELLVDASVLAPSKGRNLPSAHRQLARELEVDLQRILHISAFVYTVEQIWATFPEVVHWPSPETHNASRRTLPGDTMQSWWTKVTRKHAPSLGPQVARRLTSYLIHEPSLVLWARHQRAVGRELTKYVWVLEDDAVFVGDIRQFFLSQALAAGQQADLVSVFANLMGSIEAASHDWKRNAAFERLYGSRRVHKWEHVERYSTALIYRLDHLISRGGIAAHGEMFASTVCMAEPWCSVADLRLAGTVVGDAHLFGLSASVFIRSTRWEREALIRKRRSAGIPGVWFHSVKNYCNALSLASNGTVRVSLDDSSEPFVLFELAGVQRGRTQHSLNFSQSGPRLECPQAGQSRDASQHE